MLMRDLSLIDIWNYFILILGATGLWLMINGFRFSETDINLILLGLFVICCIRRDKSASKGMEERKRDDGGKDT